VDNALQSKLLEIIDKLQQAATNAATAAGKAAPQMLDYAIRITHWDGIQNVLVGFFLLLLASIGISIFVRKWEAICNLSHDDELCLLCFFGGVAILGTLIGALCLLLDVWNWVAIYDPKVALAHQLLQKVMERIGG